MRPLIAEGNGERGEHDVRAARPDGSWSISATSDGFVEVSVPRIAMTAEEAVQLSEALIEAVPEEQREALVS
jgi:hypothetical protein